MRRSIARTTFFILVNGILGNAYANFLSPVEQRWIDANPVVRFSIHEKYAPYLEFNDKGEAGVFHNILIKLSEFTKQEFLPRWRKSDQEGLQQLANGEVDFIIDPPTLDDEYLKFGSLSEAIFWGHDAILTKRSESNAPIEPSNSAYFDRGYENPPLPTHPQSRLSSHTEKLVFDLIKNDIEALVLPVRLAQHIIQKANGQELQLNGLYNREPFEYRWLITHQNKALHSVLGGFLNHLDPLESRNLFTLHSSEAWGYAAKSNFPQLTWISVLSILLIGALMLWYIKRNNQLHTHQTERLMNSKELAEKANAAKSSFLATMSHEIRTPMNAILGVQELLLKSQLPNNEKALLKSAHSSAESLLGILNQVLDLSKIEAGKLTLNLEPCSLNTLIDDIDSAFSTVAQIQNLSLHTSKDPRVAQVLMIDALRLRQILQNLISNAIKFTEHGEIYFSISVLADDHAGQLIEFRVVDTGVGMEAEDIEIALQAFEQIPGTSEQHKGTGLGLTITNHLVTSMGSQLYFDSAPGFGSNIHFCVAFPRTSLAASEQEPINGRTSESRRLVSKCLNKSNRTLRALVVEDHPASRQIISLQLEALGIGVVVCDNAHTALDFISQTNFDLLLTDQSIPGMQGSELARRIRDLGHRNLVIIAVTADIYALDSRHQFFAAGMNSVLIKPLSLMTLENELTRYFSIQDIAEKNTSKVGAEEYSFDAFASLLKDSPNQILVILNEIKKVHDEALEILESNECDETTFSSLVHKVKGGAQLLSAKSFIQGCIELEQKGNLSHKIDKFTQLLTQQNHVIAGYMSKYQNPKP
jgi:two-component system sensor histidine kinase EvgS